MKKSKQVQKLKSPYLQNVTHREPLMGERGSSNDQDDRSEYETELDMKICLSCANVMLY